MQKIVVFCLFTLLAPQIAQAQYAEYAPEGKVKCAYNVALKDKDACIKAAKDFNNMSAQDKQNYNQRVKEHNERQDRQRTLSELKEINRKLDRNRYR